MKVAKVLFFFLFIIEFSIAQELNSIGAGNALEFNGVNNYVKLGDIYDDLYPPFSVSAWIYIDKSVNTWAPIFVSQDNSNTYKGTAFIVSKDKIGIEYGDGRGWNNPQYRRSKGANVGNITNKWIHVVGIIRSATDMDLYINGLNVQGTYSGSSPYPMVNKLGDVAKIGTWHSNDQYFWFKGKMDELRIWDYSRSQEEIRRDMCIKLKGDESGLIGYWRFDEIAGNEVKDYSKNNFHGQLVNGTDHIISGASIGDESVYSYSANLNNESISIGDKGIDHLTVNNISKSAKAIQLYRINSSPKDVSGINTTPIASSYYGLFIGNYTSESIEYDINIINNCSNGVYFRKNNSSTPWKKIESDESHAYIVYDNVDKSKEVLVKSGPEIDLGADTTLCQGQSYTIKLDDTKFDNIVWSNGSLGSSFKIDEPGTFWAKATSDCGVSIDTIKITYFTKPLISLGEDMIVCNEEEVQLSVNPKGINRILWQDGSSDSTFIAKEPGVYWVKVENQCGISFDTIKIEHKIYSKIFLPNVVTPNNDTFNDKFFIDDQITEAELTVFNRWGRKVYTSDKYRNEWPSQNIHSGVYYYYLKDACSKKKYKGFIQVLK